jgi:Raf kinase inhibitor-like YbhB/YbcL family protein
VAAGGEDGGMRPALAPAVLAALVLAGCGSSAASRPAAPTVSAATLTVTSSAFTEGAPLPAANTCVGAGTAPALAWAGDARGATAFAVVVDDPDAPGGTFTHWVVLDLPPGASSLADPPPAGAHQAQNSTGQPGWTPPCPPSGTHHYRFTVYGLRTPTGLPDGAPTADALAAIQANAIVEGRLTGLVSH